MDKETKQLLDEIDTAFMVLNIGRDHGITPQAAKACREAWIKVRFALCYKDSGCMENAFKNSRCD